MVPTQNRVNKETLDVADLREKFKATSFAADDARNDTTRHRE
jgi:hypothetical protein